MPVAFAAPQFAVVTGFACLGSATAAALPQRLPDDAEVEVNATPGSGVSISAGSAFSLNVLNTLQLRGRHVRSDRAPPATDAEIVRGRTRLLGHLWSESNVFFLQTEWRSDTPLLDVWLRTQLWAPSADDSVDLQVGQMPPRHGRQFESPIVALELTSRSLVSDTFSGNRVLAARLQGTHLRDASLWWSAGLVHGDPARASAALEAANGARNVDADFDFVADVSFDPQGRLELTEADLDTRQDLRGSLGLSLATGRHQTVAPPGGVPVDTTSLHLNSAWKGYGLHLLGEVFGRRDRQRGGTDATSLGWTVQASYTLPAPPAGGPQWGFAARRSLVRLDDPPVLLTRTALGTVSGEIRELAGTVSAYLHAHHLKAQLTYSHLNVAPTAGADFDEAVVELLLQVQF